MTPLHRILHRGRGHGLLVLRALLEREPMRMAQFTEASRLHASTAHKLRLFLEAEGLIEVEHLGQQGAVENLKVRLSPEGREVAGYLAQAEAALAAAQARRAQSSG